ncbi:MAG: hypothetical protein EA422_01320 [Gemmatimonadales bacterium]|nr:MAG: hypothetical protein EA422_01320 [Gemmatimonadales bacterium]
MVLDWSSAAEISLAPGERTPDPVAGEWAGRLSRARIATEVGSADGDPRSTIGLITEGALLSTGDFVVLDRSYYTLRRWTADGRALPSLGRPGRGPGEFFQPNAMAQVPGDTLLVVDADRRLHRVPAGNRELDGTEFTSEPVAFSRHWFCQSGETTYAVLPQPDRGPKLMSWGGSIGDTITLTSFYRSVDPLVATAFNSGAIACSTDEGVLAAAANPIPVVKLRLRDGTLRDLHLNDMRPWRVTLYSDRSMGSGGFQRGADVMHSLARLHLLDPTTLLIQIRERRRLEGVPLRNLPADIVTLVVTDLEQPEPTVVRLDGLEEILSVGQTGFLSFRNEPYPRVRLWEFGP